MIFNKRALCTSSLSHRPLAWQRTSPGATIASRVHEMTWEAAMHSASSVAPILADLFFCSFLVVVAFAAALIVRGVRNGIYQG